MSYPQIIFMVLWRLWVTWSLSFYSPFSGKITLRLCHRPHAGGGIKLLQRDEYFTFVRGYLAFSAFLGKGLLISFRLADNGTVQWTVFRLL